MSDPLIIALPSKGRLKEQAEAWLAASGFRLESDGGERGYRARLRELPGAEVRLLSAGDIASALDTGDAHLGVTGEDVIREREGAVDGRVMLLRALGFGRADLVVAAPQSWIDVETMSDLEDVAHLYMMRTGQRVRVATKYGVQTRAFFASQGVGDYRIVESSGATEGAPAAGAAELVVDITTTGATLQANNLKIVGGGVILRSQAQLAASLTAEWSQAKLEAAQQLMSVVEAKARAASLASIRWPAELDGPASRAVRPFLTPDATRRSDGLLIPQAQLFEVAAALSAHGIGPLSVTRLDYVFEPSSEAADRLAARLGMGAAQRV